MDRADYNREAVSAELDAMVGEVLDGFLDALAEGEDPGVAVCLEDASGVRYLAAFTEDGAEACLNGARQFISEHADGVRSEHMGPVARYALAYLGCVELESGYQDAIIASFYERGLASGYSAYVLVDGIGEGEDFRWADPEPAGAEEALV